MEHLKAHWGNAGVFEYFQKAFGQILALEKLKA